MEVEKDSEPAIHHLVEFLKRKKQKELSRKWRILKCCQSFQWQGYRALGLGANLYICMEYWKSWRPKTGEEKASVSQRPPPYGYVKRPLKGQSTQEVGLAGGTFLSDSSDQLSCGSIPYTWELKKKNLTVLLANFLELLDKYLHE